MAAATIAAAPARADTLDVYSSLPLQGVSAEQSRDIVRGIRLALSEADGRAGSFDIGYTSLDDSSRKRGNWDPAKCSQDARRAAADPATILYIGELNSGCSAISIPILNEENVSQISPSNTYNGLTTSEPGTCCGEPDRYYPSGKRTFVRLPPRDTMQGEALLKLMRDAGCKKVALANDKDTYGQGIGRVIELVAPGTGVKLTEDVGIDKSASNYRGVAKRFRRAGADCFLFGGITANHAPQLYRDVHAALPKARLFGPDGVCEPAFTRRVGTAIRRLFRCSIATYPLVQYPGGDTFLDSFAAMFGTRTPHPYAIHGYEAMKLGLDTIAALGAAGNQPEAVRQALFATRHRESVLGTYSIDSDGDTTLSGFAIYRVSSKGHLVFDRAVKAG